MEVEDQAVEDHQLPFTVALGRERASKYGAPDPLEKVGYRLAIGLWF
jgi:hypothetical protein